MKSTGIVRKIDPLGRVVLPVEMRRVMDISVKEDCRDAVEIYVEGNCIILKKYQPECVFCGSSKDVAEFKEKNVCANCRKELAGE